MSFEEANLSVFITPSKYKITVKFKHYAYLNCLP